MESEKNVCTNMDNLKNGEAAEAVNAWHTATEDDVLGSYTGMGEDCNNPVQDADDL